MTPPQRGTPLRVGAYYLPRGGQEVLRQHGVKAFGPIRPLDCPSGGYLYHDGTTTRQASGGYYKDDRHPRDLVLECTADGVPLIGTETPAAYEGECAWLKTVEKPDPVPFAFAAGQFYRLANGGVTGPMMKSADGVYWCDPEHKNATGAPWEYRDDGTTEPAEFNIVGLADDGVKTAKPSAKPGTELEIRGAWIPKGDALTVASLIGACEHMLYKRQALQDEGRLAYADAGPSVAVAELPIENAMTCELRVGDIVRVCARPVEGDSLYWNDDAMTPMCGKEFPIDSIPTTPAMFSGCPRILGAANTPGPWTFRRAWLTLIRRAKP